MRAEIDTDVRKMSKYCFMAIENRSAWDTPLFTSFNQDKTSA